jgi:putative ABC transport system permease protein
MSLHREILDRIRSQPGVESSATIYGLPFGTMLNATCGVALDNPSTSDNQQAKVHCAWRVVSPGYFETLRVPILAGRSFSEKLDSATSLPVAIINESFARKHFPGQNPLGRTIQIFPFETNWHKTIVGVIHDVKLSGLDAPVVPEIYQPTSQQAPWMFSLVVRSSLPPPHIENLVRSQVGAVDKDLVPFNIRTMESAIRSSVGGPRFTTTLIGLFAALALALTVVGIYGVISYSVSRRTREIGIRLALGATRGSVIQLVLRRGLILTLLGAGLGLCGSFALTRLIASQLFEVSPHDPMTFATVVILLMLVALSACYLPSRRAARVEPMTALRAD